MNWENVCNYNREVSYQARLDKTLERQYRKLNDNRIRHVGIPEDVLIIKRKRTRNGDTVSTVISDHKLVNMIFPPLKDIPVRKIKNEYQSGYSMTSLVTAHGEGSEKGQGNEQKDLTTITVYVPFDTELDIDDTVVRVFVQEDVNSSTVAVFTVLDTFADFSNNAPLNLKVLLAISTEPVDLDKPSYQLIMALAKRRLAANY